MTSADPADPIRVLSVAQEDESGITLGFMEWSANPGNMVTWEVGLLCVKMVSRSLCVFSVPTEDRALHNIHFDLIDAGAFHSDKCSSFAINHFSLAWVLFGKTICLRPNHPGVCQWLTSFAHQRTTRLKRLCLPRASVFQKLAINYIFLSHI